MRGPGTLLAVVALAGLTLTGCNHSAIVGGASTGTSVGSTDPLGSLEASVDGISRELDGDAAG